MKLERYKMIYREEFDEDLVDKMDGIYFNEKFIKENINIRILGHYFVENNKNKGKLIINNKKYALREFINDEEHKDNNILKIRIILNKELSNISYMFHNCYKLKEIYNYDNETNIDDDESQEYQEYLNFNADIKSINENSNDDSSFNFNIYKNLKKDDIYSNNSQIKNKKINEKEDISDFAIMKNKLLIYRYYSYCSMSSIFYNCYSLTTFGILRM